MGHQPENRATLRAPPRMCWTSYTPDLQHRHKRHSQEALFLSLRLKQSHHCETKISSNKLLKCQRFLQWYTVIIVKFIKSMQQDRQKQLRIRGRREKEEESEKGREKNPQHSDSGSQKQDTRKQVGTERSAKHSEIQIILLIIVISSNNIEMPI